MDKVKPRLRLVEGSKDDIQDLVEAGQATHNPGVWLCTTKLDRIAKEIVDSLTGNQTASSSFDITRLNQFIADYEKLLQYLAAEPQQDWVATHPRAFELPSEPQFDDAENEDVLFFLADLVRTRAELISSSTNRMPQGIQAHDLRRQTSFIAKLKAFVTNYIGAKVFNTPGQMDYVESDNAVANNDTDDAGSGVTAE